MRNAARNAAWDAAWDAAWAAQSNILRDIVTLNRVVILLPHKGHWQIAKCIAEQVYAGDWAALPILADAIEEAGGPWDNSLVVEHLRSPGPHVKGCWAIDLILDKE